MRVLVADLLGKPGASRDISLTEDLELAMDMARLIGPVEVEARIDVMSRDLIVAGTIDYRAEVTCHRCLTKLEQSGRARFSQVYGPEAEEDGDVLPIDRDGTIDLLPPVRDEVGVSLPLAPVCRDDCAGLCPTCGTDLNTEPCDGHEELSSSPFAVLEHLLDPQE